MGRGQQGDSTVADQFAAVMGNRRGLRPEQVAYSSVPADPKKRKTAPFAREQAAAVRRLRLVTWWLDKSNPYAPLQAKQVLRLFGEYKDIQINDKQILRRHKTQEATCRNDLAALVKQGVCTTVRDTTNTFYSIVPFKEWPEEHREMYARAHGVPLDTLKYQ